MYAVTIREVIYTKNDPDADGNAAPNYESAPASNLLWLFYYWLREIDRGDDDGAKHYRYRFDEAREILAERSPNLAKPLWILQSAMKLGNVDQAKHLWPEIDYELTEIKWTSEIPDPSGEESERLDGKLNEASVDAARGSTIPLEYCSKPISQAKAALRYFRNIAYSKDHKEQEFRKMVATNEIQSVQIKPPNGRLFYFDKRQIETQHPA